MNPKVYELFIHVFIMYRVDRSCRAPTGERLYKDIILRLNAV